MSKIPISKLIFAAITVFGGALGSCGQHAGTSSVDTIGPDHDQDGFLAPLDCQDDNRLIHPGAAELCDGVDSDCDGMIDEGHDLDGDYWTTCAGDCRDNDPTSYPRAPELDDGFDNDCNGRVDDGTSSQDDDGDGFSESQGDCNDDPSSGGELVGPMALEVTADRNGLPEGQDNDCDGLVDESLEPCPTGGALDDPMTYVNAMEACHMTLHAWWTDEIFIDSRSRSVYPRFGDEYTPHAGPDFVVLSTGIAGDAGLPQFSEHSTDLGGSTLHPDPQPPNGCSGADPSEISDYTELVLRMRVPANAQALSFDFNFMSTEFPEWVCSNFDDTFLALLESQAFTGNVSFDAMNNRVSINVGFFNVCDTDAGYPMETAACQGGDPLRGTGYGSRKGGGTGWLTTTAPVVPGEKITLRFALFDEGDGILDSTVLLDNFRWEIEEFVCPGGGPPPCTIERVPGPRTSQSVMPWPLLGPHTWPRD